MIRLIAEASCNHGGSLSRAIEMAEIAKWAGADTVKYQCVSPEGVPESARDYYRRVAFTESQWATLKHEVEALGLKFLCTPQTVEDFKLLLRIGITEVKVSSDNFSNERLWWEIEKSGLPIIASYGMHRPPTFTKARGNLVWMACTSEYPCPPESVRLSPKLTPLGPWGFSDHTTGSTAAILAMGMGARVFEKHFWTGGYDGEKCEESAWACNPNALKAYFDALKEAWVMLGEGLPAVTEKEKELREALNAG